MGSVFFLAGGLACRWRFSIFWYKTYEAASAADKWFGLIHQAQFEEAYRLASPAFQEAISLQLFRERAELVGLTRGKPSVWGQREISREAVKMATGILGEKSTTPLTV